MENFLRDDRYNYDLKYTKYILIGCKLWLINMKILSIGLDNKHIQLRFLKIMKFKWVTTMSSTWKKKTQRFHL